MTRSTEDFSTWVLLRTRRIRMVIRTLIDT
jgi:hypothetical protein